MTSKLNREMGDLKVFFFPIAPHAFNRNNGNTIVGRADTITCALLATQEDIVHQIRHALDGLLLSSEERYGGGKGRLGTVSFLLLAVVVVIVSMDGYINTDLHSWDILSVYIIYSCGFAIVCVRLK